MKRNHKRHCTGLAAILICMIISGGCFTACADDYAVIGTITNTGDTVDIGDVDLEDAGADHTDEHISDEELASMDYIYVTEGNTFEVLELMQMRRVMEPMRTAVMNGATYIGASAGAIIAGTDIALAADFDRNFVRLQNLEGLKLFDGTIIPHYTKEELARYIKNSDDEAISHYHVIYSVANGAKKIL